MNGDLAHAAEASPIGRRAFLAGLMGVGAASPAIAATPTPPGDLSGVWTNATYTPLERPDGFPRLALSPEEAESFEAVRRANGGRPPSAPGAVGQTESEFLEMGSGLMRIGGEIRASILVEPPDGRLPYRPEARTRLARTPERLDHPEARPSFERCLASSGSGAPLIPSMDANVTAIVQTRDAVVVVSEKLSEARVITLGADLPARPLPSWTGTSVGRWQDGTLHVETVGLRAGVTDRFFFFLGGGARVRERFTRSGPDEILYAFSVEDDELYHRPWRGELVFTPAPGALFEYACHEGNYGLPNILRGARRMEEEAGR